jgi:two-component system sensor histidine kinase RegB
MNVKVMFRRAPAHLRMLVLMRAAAILAEALILYCADCILEIQIPLAPVLGVIGFYALLDFATFLRLAHPAPVTELEMLAQLLVDAALLTALLYFTGGESNPLALYYLLLVLYSSIALPPRLVWVLAAACVLFYIGLHFFYIELSLPPSAAIDGALDYFARFLMYVFIAVMIAWFGIKLSAIQRLQRDHARTQAEKDARERYLVGLAALAAGTAHELSTPLSTISVVVGELRDSKAPPPDWKENIDTLWSQVQLCRRSLAAMASGSDVQRLGETTSEPASRLIADLAARFRSLRPEVPFKLRIEVDDDLMLYSDDTLPQAFMSFLNNAADASPGSVELCAAQDRLDCLKLVIEVLDRGPGIDPQLRERIGKDLITTKAAGAGNGTGFLIAQAAIERFGGTVTISRRRSGGTCVRTELACFRPAEDEEKDYRRARVASR